MAGGLPVAGRGAVKGGSVGAPWAGMGFGWWAALEWEPKRLTGGGAEGVAVSRGLARDGTAVDIFSSGAAYNRV